MYIHKQCIYAAYVYTLLMYIRCLCIYTAYVYTLLMYIHCLCIYAAYVYMLLMYIHCAVALLLTMTNTKRISCLGLVIKIHNQESRIKC